MIPLFDGLPVPEWSVVANVLWYLVIALLVGSVCNEAWRRARRHGAPVPQGWTTWQVVLACGLLGLAWPVVLIALGVGVVVGFTRRAA